VNEAEPDPPLDVAQSMRVSKLTQEDLWDIDRELLMQSARSWRKVAPHRRTGHRQTVEPDT
jgi:hypothetical protein